MNRLQHLRRELHHQPELSGQEEQTALRILSWFESMKPDKTLRGLGGQGCAFVFKGREPGPTVVLRCELDALPIAEENDFEHRSKNRGVSHKCGHDGHMAILAGVGLELAQERPKRGKVVLLYQPAEETGEGARDVLQDERFLKLEPDWVFALHNLPGYPLGDVLVKEGSFLCGSAGLRVRVAGRSSHASHPEDAQSPWPILGALPDDLSVLHLSQGGFNLSTVTHVRMGEPTFGITPGEGELRATLRAADNDTLTRLRAEAERLVHEKFTGLPLNYELSWHEEFAALNNSEEAVAAIRRAAESCGRNVREFEDVQRWSEDFSEFTARYKGAMFGLGAGEDATSVHSPSYDFPDELLPIGKELMLALVREKAGLDDA